MTPLRILLPEEDRAGKQVHARPRWFVGGKSRDGVAVDTWEQPRLARAQAEIEAVLAAERSQRQATRKGLPKGLALERERASRLEAVLKPPLDLGSCPETRCGSRSRIRGGHSAGSRL